MSESKTVPITEVLLDEIEEFLDDQADVLDGSYGDQIPNKAMRLLSDLRREMDK